MIFGVGDYRPSLSSEKGIATGTLQVKNLLIYQREQDRHSFYLNRYFPVGKVAFEPV